jgi:APA family basic amino acid/polyamine antiporter
LSEHRKLRRELGLPGAVVVGLGSILGSGAFVAIGLAAGMWGDAVLIGIPLAGLVAVFNGLSSAFLAGRFPVAGGTYEYAYRTVGPRTGFVAGWLFLLAKTASAATAGLGIALYLGVDAGVPVALGAIALMTLLLLGGLRRTAVVNAILVSVTVAGLVTFAWAGLSGATGAVVASSQPEQTSVLAAIAFLFVAYTGYGRVATLGEEVRRPERNIPRAVIITLMVAIALYLGVAFGGRALGGPSWGFVLSLGTTPARLVDEPFSVIVGFAAITAMFGVLLNLILGLSRVWLAMARRADIPKALAVLDSRDNPSRAVVLSGAFVCLVALLGDIGLAWSFSAMTVLLYYGLTNLAALRLDLRRLSAWAGMASCAFLSMFVPLEIWLIGAVLVAVGLAWKAWVVPKSELP